MPTEKPVTPNTDLPDDPIEAAIRNSLHPADAADDLDTGDADGTAVVDNADAAGDTVQQSADADAADAAAGADAAARPVDSAAAAPDAAATDAVKPADAAAAAAAVKPAKTEDKFAAEHGIKATDKSGRENRIPYSVIRDRIVPNAVKKARADWEAKDLAPAKKVIQTYETRLQGIAGTENLMFGLDAKGNALPAEAGLASKRQFLQQLAMSVPGYKELLSGTNVMAGDTKTGVKPASATETAVDPNNDPEPKPDVIENGVAVGYSEKGLASLRAWDRRQAAREAADATLARLDKEYNLTGMSTAFRGAQNRQQSLADTDRVIDTALTWPGFKENADAILSELNGLPATVQGVDAMRSAYNNVMWKLANQPKTDRATLEAELRAKFVQELQDAPRSTSAGGGAISTRAAEDVPTSGDPVEDAIRRSIRGVAGR